MSYKPQSVANRAEQKKTFVREPAKRVLAREFRDIKHEVKEGTDEKAPRFALLPTGEKANRIFVVGVLLEKEKRGDTNPFYRIKIQDPTGNVYGMVSNYKPEAMQSLSDINPPAFVAVVGKASLYETPEGTIMTSLAVETISVVDKNTRNMFLLDAMRATMERIEKNDSLPDIALIRQKYGEMSLRPYVDAVKVAGDMF